MDEHILWQPQPKQIEFIQCPADDVAFGGARGGGKTDGVLGDWMTHEKTYGSSAIGLAVRRQRTELVEMIERGKQIFLPQGYSWHHQDSYFRGPNGGRLRFSYLENDSDADAYQGQGFTRLYPEEIGNFPSEAPINKLQATLRSGNGVPCRMKATCNPGGAGHHWVKNRYKLDTHPKGMEVFEYEFKNPFTGEKITKRRVFIPSKVNENKYLGSDYVANLFQVGSETLVRAWLDGDWSVIEGAFFDGWAQHKHVLQPFAIPDDWLRFRSMDWGSAKPFSVNWFAVVADAFQTPCGKTLPRGALVQYREWYGMKAGQANVGLKMTAEEVADGIREREHKDKIRYGVLDPAAFTQDGGPSIAERMAARRVIFSRADNKRVARAGALGGWDMLRQRLDGVDGVPHIYFFSTCEHTIRTLPALQHDPDKPEDVDTEGEDHAPDSVRYGVMSRPWVPSPVKNELPKGNLIFQLMPNGSVRSNISITELVRRQERKRKRSAA